MKCAIVQPSYLPWRGVFSLMASVDIYVSYDCVQYDARGWRNRNKISSENGDIWITVPVNRKGVQKLGTAIKDITIDASSNWRTKHIKSIRHSYARSPFGSYLMDFLEHAIPHNVSRITDLTIPLTMSLAQELGTMPGKWIRSSELPEITGNRTERLLNVIKAIGADEYFSGPSASSYLDIELLSNNGICTKWVSYDTSAYPGKDGRTFNPYLSVIDLIAMTGPDAKRYVGECTLIPADT